MEKDAWLKICYEIVVIFNVLSIIVWLFLAIFPGIYYLSQNDIITGLQLIFLNIWCLIFVSTLLLGILLHSLLEQAKNEIISE
jgi:membrane protein DedA with SNARE-associated domain